MTINREPLRIHVCEIIRGYAGSTERGGSEFGEELRTFASARTDRRTENYFGRACWKASAEESARPMAEYLPSFTSDTVKGSHQGFDPIGFVGDTISSSKHAIVQAAR